MERAGQPSNGRHAASERHHISDAETRAVANEACGGESDPVALESGCVETRAPFLHGTKAGDRCSPGQLQVGAFDM
jgi:hypothetical protein